MSSPPDRSRTAGRPSSGSAPARSDLHGRGFGGDRSPTRDQRRSWHRDERPRGARGRARSTRRWRLRQRVVRCGLRLHPTARVPPIPLATFSRSSGYRSCESHFANRSDQNHGHRHTSRPLVTTRRNKHFLVPNSLTGGLCRASAPAATRFTLDVGSQVAPVPCVERDDIGIACERGKVMLGAPFLTTTIPRLFDDLVGERQQRQPGDLRCCSPPGSTCSGGSKTGSFATCLPRLEGTLQASEYRRNFEMMAQEHADSLFVGADAESWVYRRLIVELAEKDRLPAIYPYREYVEAGGLMAYSVDFVELWTRAAGCIAQILNGATPWALPLHPP